MIDVNGKKEVQPKESLKYVEEEVGNSKCSA